jgi:hypothetical protein
MLLCFCIPCMVDNVRMKRERKRRGEAFIRKRTKGKTIRALISNHIARTDFRTLHRRRWRRFLCTAGWWRGRCSLSIRGCATCASLASSRTDASGTIRTVWAGAADVGFVRGVTKDIWMICIDSIGLTKLILEGSDVIWNGILTVV